MCGLIAAFATGRRALSDVGLDRALRSMLARGPDGGGVWREDFNVLGHRRLAILDLDPRAEQPMHSGCGRYVIVFNGEIYNFRDLRRGLEAQGVSFRTTSDTEVLLELFKLHGEAMLPRLHGMFALVIWDRVAKRAFAARDPYGIKPLYYSELEHGVVMASQVKALLATGLISLTPDLHGQAGFWMLGSVPEPHTWYQHIRALPAGHCVWIDEGRLGSIKRWWHIGEAWHTPRRGGLSSQEVREQVRHALRESVSRHLVADVPVGVFLSGGIDSGTLAGLMLEAGAHSLQGVTISYDEFAGTPADEAPKAARIAAHYGIQHHVRRVTREEFRTDLPRILSAMDQPSIDGINTWYASKAVAERGLKVVVSGVGGDELFQGYSSFDELPRLVAARGALGRVPGAARLARPIASALAARSGNSRWEHAYAWADSIPSAWWLRRSLYSPSDLPELMGVEAANEVLREFDAQQYVERMSGPLPVNPRLALGQIESCTYLRNQLLRDSDWASMDHSVELRTPLVDAHLLDQVKPLLAEFERFPNKGLLAQAPQKPMPQDVLSMPKTGFGIPVAQWLADVKGLSRDHGSRGWAREVARAYEGKSR